GVVAPYAPHFAEELWSLFGHERSIFSATWPVFDERLAAAGDVEVVLQVNGKVRGRVTVGRGASEAEVVALAMQDESVRKFVDGKQVGRRGMDQIAFVSWVARAPVASRGRPSYPPAAIPVRPQTLHTRRRLGHGAG